MNDEQQAAVDEWLSEAGMFPPESAVPACVAAVTLNDAKVLDLAFSAKNGDKVRNLYLGDIAKYDGDDSAADFALASHLAFWSGPNPEQIERLMRRSNLARPKWDERRPGGTYLTYTIENVLRNQTEFYTPAAQTMTRTAPTNGERAPGTGGGTIEDVETVVRRWLLLPDLSIVRLLAATVAVNLSDCDPLWTFIISPPSSGKTELLNALNGIPTIYRLSELTPQTLLSGFREDKAPSLLPKLTGKIVVFKDFTTVLTMRREARQAILAQLREVYDGTVSKAFGTGKSVQWSGKIGFIAGVTEIIDTHYAVYQVLGERFVQYRLPTVEPLELARFAIKHRGRETAMRGELREAFAGLFHGRRIPPIADIVLPGVLQEEIASLASFVVRARSGIIRDAFSTREIEFVPEPEAPARLAKQLASLAAALAVIDGAAIVGDSQMPLVAKVALDCLLKPRHRVLTALLSLGADPSTSDVAEAIDYPTSTTRRILEDLAALRVLSREKTGQGRPDLWHLTDTTETVLRAALARVSGTVSETSDGHITSSPDRVINTPHSHRDDFSGKVVGTPEIEGPETVSVRLATSEPTPWP